MSQSLIGGVISKTVWGMFPKRRRSPRLRAGRSVVDRAARSVVSNEVLEKRLLFSMLGNIPYVYAQFGPDSISYGSEDSHAPHVKVGAPSHIWHGPAYSHAAAEQQAAAAAQTFEITDAYEALELVTINIVAASELGTPSAAVLAFSSDGYVGVVSWRGYHTGTTDVSASTTLPGGVVANLNGSAGSAYFADHMIPSPDTNGSAVLLRIKILQLPA